jgi:hypothetical protein
MKIDWTEIRWRLWGAWRSLCGNYPLRAEKSYPWRGLFIPK